MTLKWPAKDDPIWDKIQAAAAGEDLTEYQAAKALNISLFEEGEAYWDLPVEQWPPVTFNWDVTRESQRFAFDGVKKAEFAESRPNGFKLGWIPLVRFDKHLCHFSRRDGPVELWELGSRSSLARAIAYLRRGLPITPPLITATDGEFRIVGGHHRYAVAKAVNLEILPIYVDHSDADLVNAIAAVEWESAVDP